MHDTATVSFKKRLCFLTGIIDLFSIVSFCISVGKGVKLPLHARIPILPSDECHRRYRSLPDNHQTRTAVSIEASVLCATADGDGNDSCWVY